MQLSIPDFSLVLLVGPSGSGKSTFARRCFATTEVVSSDACRALVADDETDQAATPAAFEVLRLIAAKRLEARRLTVIDATNVRAEDRRGLVELARAHHALAVAIVFDVGEEVCHARNRDRPDRRFGPHVVRNQAAALRRSLKGLGREGFRFVHRLASAQEADAAEIERRPLWTDRRSETGPFDIIGDVHGCHDELVRLLRDLGYAVEDGPEPRVVPPSGRKAVFLGDLVDRGPAAPAVLRLVMGMVGAGDALCVPGNHEAKLLRALKGGTVKPTHGLAETLAQFEAEPPEFARRAAAFIDGLVSHYVLDGGRLVVAHAGMKESMQNRASGAVRAFALFGETSGESDEFGLPVRHDWARDYRGAASVVYGHTPVAEARWVNRTICIDTGCVFGGRLTALRWPERQLVSVPAARTWCEPVRPLDRGDADGGTLDIGDVLGKRIIETRLHRTVTIREDNAAAALETMSRFAADPRWLIYLPPTMSPSETSRDTALLEHPAEAFAYYRSTGIGRVVCEEKHMGSRAVVIACRDADAARRRFGAGGGTGIVHTRTGRPFFADASLQEALLDRVRAALGRTRFWDRFGTDWVCLDAELMPWSAKAQALLAGQYAPVGAAARAGLREAEALLARTAARGVDVAALADRTGRRAAAARAFTDAYRRYCWPVGSVEDLRLAPFHLLATEGRTHVDRDHAWHMETLGDIAATGTPFAPTAWRSVDLDDAASCAAAVSWWEALTAAGGEGMVVKPAAFVAAGAQGPVQPALKCRGREYLRLIYGPEYDFPENLERLRARGLGAKRSLALREFALGVEGLERFVAGDPPARVHECVFGVLALESEPVDPRL
ncbi:polynucleotide kinase-phosphatase [Skermanella sp. TT6]|uniref:Polynucleotide kinase-phosphatase n=1 Tax=Skermanella cutis TaxID=2775420 RepID=A0ABX7B6W4_9PROT|nr:polynucleotide kinase-phosphatase [Skermanella sp. TT6]QQP89858.1 polynucleotide kinase-phosphatase [Skermanella sp. TT6]